MGRARCAKQQSRGSVVYILRNLSFLDFLALDHLTKRHGLPRIRFANDLGLWVLEPMGKGWLRALTPQESRSTHAEELTHIIREGGSAALFLKRPPADARSHRRQDWAAPHRSPKATI